jgi:asparagine synthase (glutamine-hydrolysing)
VKVAREHGVRAIFAGDGGDELFAGNERYGGDKVFQLYHRVPGILRTALIEPAVRLLSPSGIPPFPKAMKYIRRANIPNPDRMFSYSPSRTIPMYGEMLDGALQEAALRQEPFWAYRERYKVADARSELNRFMYLDMKGAIADNDLPKVTRMAELAGLKVQFPFLSHRLAEIAGRIPSNVMMRGFRLRSFFKRAYRDFLPVETIRKQKHGFGLPIPVWLRTDPGLKEMAHELLLSPRAVQRGYFRKSFLEDVFRKHQVDTTSFYGTLIWNLMMLELWHRHHYDAPYY